jgi:hypothetical protein
MAIEDIIVIFLLGEVNCDPLTRNDTTKDV